MQQIIVGTANALKTKCVSEAVSRVFEEKYQIIQYDAHSGVGEQPTSRKDICIGAQNRIARCREQYPQAAYYVAIESGIVFDNIVRSHFDTSITIIAHSSGAEGWAWSTHFEVIKEVANLVAEGLTLGKATDMVFGTSDIGNKEGYSGIVTDNLIPRVELHLQPTIFAFKTLLLKQTLA